MKSNHEKVSNASKLLDPVAEYYTGKIKRFSTTSQGVDWNSTESQNLRFQQLMKILPSPHSNPMRVLDYGCGYGALVDSLLPLYPNMHYDGFDIANEMIANAQSRCRDHESCRFFSDPQDLKEVDFVIASGLFNVKLESTDSDWTQYIHEILDQFNQLSRTGFSFNMLTSYSDLDKMKSHLHYASPTNYFDLCKKKYAKQVALLHDYGLYEFTILVRKLL